MCTHRSDYDQYESLPAWARASLELHESDERAYLYSLEQLSASKTHDPIWNAAQNELRETGRLQNYLRMLWGKKILEWSPTAKDALSAMIELNNKYALDGRDPNSYSGIFWVLGRYDRAWGPERPIFGKIRYMSSENTKRKLRMRDYLDRFGDQASLTRSRNH
jgi:deoxyribodipyrimidine photo-lyase